VDDSLADRIDAVLPQTQCGRCGYDRCRPYALALARGEAPINRCPPGGAATIEVLARLLSRPPQALDPACGAEQPLAAAQIDEAACIGCTLCIQACPVDAIVGAAKRMHTVVASLCTGCERCLPPCPVDCIAMVLPSPPRAWIRKDAEEARLRMQRRDARLDQERRATEQRLAEQAAAGADGDCEFDACDVDASAERVAWLTLRSVACADSTTATSNS
jgi:Na+-translocating ferredoxin:NAD+ oxidoreductase subunit B